MKYWARVADKISHKDGTKAIVIVDATMSIPRLQCSTMQLTTTCYDSSKGGKTLFQQCINTHAQTTNKERY